MTHEEAVALLEAMENSDEIKNPLALLENLRNANAEAKANREALAEANQKVEVLEKFKGGSKTNAVVRELKAQGVKNPDRIIRFMDTENIEFSEDGSLTGFDEQFEGVKTEYPELFDKKRQAPAVEQFQRTDPEVNRSGTALQLDQFLEAHNR